MLYVRIINNEVKQVWDTPPPAGESGWKSAVEVRPSIVAHRQGYTAHRFDLTTDPVQIIWDTYEISVADRKVGMKANAKFVFQQVVNEQTYNVEIYDPAVIESARQVMLAKQTAIEAATTHEQLDALM
jgi:hypothetical protein